MRPRPCIRHVGSFDELEDVSLIAVQRERECRLVEDGPLGCIGRPRGNAEVVELVGVDHEAVRRVGVDEAVHELAMSFGSIGAVVGGYLLIAKFFRQQRVLDRLLLTVPVIGACMRSFAIAHFSWAFALTQQAGMRILPSLAAFSTGASPPPCRWSCWFHS